MSKKNIKYDKTIIPVSKIEISNILYEINNDIFKCYNNILDDVIN
jgi:hypothetical protein